VPRTRNDNQTFFTAHSIMQDVITLRTGFSMEQKARGDNVYFWGKVAFTLCNSSGIKMTWEQFKSEAAAESAARSASGGGGGGGGSGDGGTARGSGGH
jgi:hypothetical protein